jgi:hypothetical protein
MRRLPSLWFLFLSWAMLVAFVPRAFAQPSCAPPQKPVLDIEFLLGRAGGDWKWRTFLAREVTPRFPDGLTVYETAGQWRDPATKVITREKSRVLRIIAPTDTTPEKIAAVAEAYKTQFRQKSVGIVTRQVCASF